MSEKTESTPFDRLDYTYKLLVVIALVITGSILAKDIVIPFAFAAILSVVMLPVIKRLEVKLGTTFSILLVLLGTIIFIGLFLWLVITQVISLVDDLPQLQTKLETFIDQTSYTLRRDFGISTSKQSEILADAMKSVSTFLGNLIVSTTNVISALIQIPIYIFLFLVYREKFESFLRHFLGKDESQWRPNVKRVIHGYVLGLFLVTVIIAALNSVGLMIVGIDHAIFFGILSGVLTIIPYVGIIIGALFPIVMALITKDSLWYAAGVVIVFSVVQFLEGNFITPRITGSKVSINALAAIVALLIGSKILGVAGMILAIPGIGLLKIVLSHSPHLSPFVILLEDSNGNKMGKGKNSTDESSGSDSEPETETK